MLEVISLMDTIFSKTYFHKIHFYILSKFTVHLSIHAGLSKKKDAKERQVNDWGHFFILINIRNKRNILHHYNAVSPVCYIDILSGIRKDELFTYFPNNWYFMH